jgi:hypothetical protein
MKGIYDQILMSRLYEYLKLVNSEEADKCLQKWISFDPFNAKSRINQEKKGIFLMSFFRKRSVFLSFV